jgi:integrase
MSNSSKQPKAYVVKRDGKWWARIVYYDGGRRREFRRLAETTTAAGKVTSTKTGASTLAAKLLATALATDGRALQHESTTFDDLADFYEKQFLRDVKYDHDGDKLGRGMRPKSLDTALRRLQVLREHFGDHRLQSITVDDIYAFKVERYNTATRMQDCRKCKGTGEADSGDDERPREKCRTCEGTGRVALRCWKCKGTGEARKPGRRPANATLPPCPQCDGKGRIGGGQRSWTTVNRELTLLCAALNVAENRGWIVRNPFNRAGRRGTDREKLIDPNKERRRDRIVSFAEESRLLAAINTDTTEGQRLRVVVVLALDSGMRLGEICHLDWTDVDLAAGHIDLRKRTTKTLTARRVPLTPRMRDELLSWRQRFTAVSRFCELCDDKHAHDKHAHILGNCENIGRSWRRARAIAGIPDARIHDLRHSFATRATHGGMPGILVARILGHKAPMGADEDAQLAMTTRYVGTAKSTTALAVAAIEAARAAEAGEPVN